MQGVTNEHRIDEPGGNRRLETVQVGHDQIYMRFNIDLNGKTETFIRNHNFEDPGLPSSKDPVEILVRSWQDLA